MKPYPYQREVLEKMELFDGRCLLALDMGTGKTPLSLWYLKKHKLYPSIVVCPASVKYQWVDEAEKIVPNWNVRILEGRKPGPTWGADLLVINYDILHYWVDRLLEDVPVNAVVIDECQNTSGASKRTRATQRLCYDVEHILALSGTPLTNRPIELFNVVHLLRPDVFPSKPVFGREFCDLKMSKWGLDYKGASNLPKLRELLLSSCMIRKRKSEVLKDLPPKIRQVVRLDIKNREIYNSANLNFIQWMKENNPEKVKSALRAQAVVKVGYLLRLAARLKFWYVVEWIKDYLKESDSKVIIFGNHRKMINALSRQIKASVSVIHGGVPLKERKCIMDRFQSEKNPRVLIGNIQAAGVGLNLTAADTAIFTELSWKPGDHTQAESRHWRIGQKRTCWAYYLVAKGTIEERLCKIIQEKHEIVSDILDGGKTPENLDIFSQLLSIE